MKNDEICWFVHRYILVYQSALLFHSPSTYVRLHPECCPNASWGPELSTYIDQKNKPNVGNYSIHEAFGLLRFFVFPLDFFLGRRDNPGVVPASHPPWAHRSQESRLSLGSQTPGEKGVGWKPTMVDNWYIEDQLKWVVEPKIGGTPPKMDGENNGKPYQNGWFGGKTHYFRKHPNGKIGGVGFLVVWGFYSTGAPK